MIATALIKKLITIKITRPKKGDKANRKGLSGPIFFRTEGCSIFEEIS
jgi:hypothetical protein